MNRTSIEWTTFSANPLKYRDAAGKVVWGCAHASPGCVNCYSEALAKRYGRGGPFTLPVVNTLTPFLDESELHKMLTAKTIGKTAVSGSRCFVGDMTDIFGEWVPDSLLDKLFAVFALRPDVTFQVLTKRAERMRDYLSDREYGHACGRVAQAVMSMRTDDKPVGPLPHMDGGERWWPLRNVWLGVSVENQKFADERIPLLLQTPAAVRFISAEPLLGEMDIESYVDGPCSGCGIPDLDCAAFKSEGAAACCPDCRHVSLDWVIVGGESGPGARPFDIALARSIVQQCKTAGVACFVKQLGAKPFEEFASGCDHFLSLHNKKGGSPEEWPADLRVREFPPCV